jgi:hypothetical protein
MSFSKFSEEGCFVSLMKKEIWFISFALQNYGPPADNLVKTQQSCRVLPHRFQADLQHQVKPSFNWLAQPSHIHHCCAAACGFVVWFANLWLQIVWWVVNALIVSLFVFTVFQATE